MKYLNIRTKTIFAGALGLLLFTASCEKDLEIEKTKQVNMSEFILMPMEMLKISGEQELKLMG